MSKVNFENHPCFNDKVRHSHGRIHLPVAPKCNIQCNFCDRKFDCVNESRPGVASTILTPYQAVEYLKSVMQREGANISVVGIAGPGEPFANPEETMETLRLVRKEFPGMLLCTASNGLDILPYIDELAALEVSHVTITINAVDPEIAKEVYAWARYEKRFRAKEEAGRLLVENQLEAVKKLKEKDILVKVNSIIIPGVNDKHIVEVSKKVSELGADILNCLPYYNNEGCAFSNIESPSAEMTKTIREQCKVFMPQMHHCSRCRADAAGLVGGKLSEENIKAMKEASKLNAKPKENRPNVAVCSLEGMLVNQHLGEALELYVYAKGEDGKAKLIDTRKAAKPGSGDERWKELGSSILKDCSYILAGGAGPKPKSVLAECGVDVLVVEGLIDDALETVFGEKDINKILKREAHKCGSGCGGNAQGCA